MHDGLFIGQLLYSNIKYNWYVVHLGWFFLEKSW